MSVSSLLLTRYDRYGITWNQICPARRTQWLSRSDPYRGMSRFESEGSLCGRSDRTDSLRVPCRLTSICRFRIVCPVLFQRSPRSASAATKGVRALFPAPPELRCSNQIQAIHDESLEGRYCAVPLAISVECHLPAIVNSIAGASEVSTTRHTLDFAKEKPNDHVL